MRERIDENTVGMLGDVSVPMANVTTSYHFELPNGALGQGPACLLILPDRQRWVGVGSEVRVGGATWRVVAIDAPEQELGSVTLARLPD